MGISPEPLYLSRRQFMTGAAALSATAILAAACGVKPKATPVATPDAPTQQLPEIDSNILLDLVVQGFDQLISTTIPGHNEILAGYDLERIQEIKTFITAIRAEENPATVMGQSEFAPITRPMPMTVASMADMPQFGKTQTVAHAALELSYTTLLNPTHQAVRNSDQMTTPINEVDEFTPGILLPKEMSSVDPR